MAPKPRSIALPGPKLSMSCQEFVMAPRYDDEEEEDDIGTYKDPRYYRRRRLPEEDEEDEDENDPEIDLLQLLLWRESYHHNLRRNREPIERLLHSYPDLCQRWQQFQRAGGVSAKDFEQFLNG